MKIKIPSVFVIAHDERHRGELKAALSPYYALSVFSETGPAIAALKETDPDPDVIIADHNARPLGDIGQLIARMSGENLKSGFVLTRNKDKDFRVSLDKTDRPGPDLAVFRENADDRHGGRDQRKGGTRLG